MNPMAIMWAVLLVAFVAVEAFTVSMVSVWFAFGAVGAMIASLLGAELWLQVAVFVAVSAVTLALLRPLSKKYLKPRIQATNVDALVGMIGTVEEAVDGMCGRVKLGDVTWSARSADGQTIPAGSYVRVESVQGNKLYVEPVKEAVHTN